MRAIEVRKVREFQGHSQPVYSLSPSTRPGYFLSCGSEGIVAEWNIQTGDAVAIARTQTPIFSMRLLPERKLLLLGLQSGELVFVDVESRSTLRRVQLHEQALFDFLPFPDGIHLLASSQDGHISIWNLDQLDHLHKQKISDKSIRTVVLHPDRQSLVLGASDNAVRIFDLGMNLKRQWVAHKLSVFRAAFSQDGTRLLTTGRDAHISSWDVTADYALLHSVPAHMYTVNDIALHPDGKHFFSGSMDKSIRMWETETLELKKVISFEKHACHWNGVNRLLWHEGVLLSCSDDRRIMCWEVAASGDPVH